MSGLGDVGVALAAAELAGSTRVNVASTPAAHVSDESRWVLYWRRLNTRRTLLTLSDQQLQDIGLSRAQAEREANLPFWKP